VRVEQQRYLGGEMRMKQLSNINYVVYQFAGAYLELLLITHRFGYIFIGGLHYLFRYVSGTFPLGFSPIHAVTVREVLEPI
jgi:hypothetical protein